jgi:OOP family OmpA-OmpF porin
MKKILSMLYFLFLATDCPGQELAPTEDKALITFKVTDYKEVPEEGAVITIAGIDTNITEQGIAGVDGNFKLLLPEGKKFKFSVNKFGEDFNFDKPLDIPKSPGTIRFEKKIKIQLITEYVRTYTLDHVYFDINKYDIKKESLPALNLLLATLKDNPKMKVEIAGHTDNAGDDKLNMELSQKRADEVQKFLVSKGIPQSHILAKGYGETTPVASNDDEAGRQKNRRTEVRVIAE